MKLLYDVFSETDGRLLDHAVTAAQISAKYNIAESYARKLASDGTPLRFKYILKKINSEKEKSDCETFTQEWIKVTNSLKKYFGGN